ncbi:SOS response-associated peptidase [bacterium]|nr:SOS response-associated peptidase [bacterium]
MCGRFFREPMSWAEYRETALAILTSAAEALPPHDDIRPTTTQPVVAIGRDGPALVNMRWELVPFWWSKPLKEKRFSTFNARIETIAGSRAFARPWARRQRCLVPASGWYEWKAGETPKTKSKFLVRRADTPNFMFAGLWEKAVVEDRDVLSFTILTTASEGQMADLHHRSPYPMTPGEAVDWLTADDIRPPPAPPADPVIAPIT